MLPALVAALVAAPVALGMVALALARAALELRGRRETRREQVTVPRPRAGTPKQGWDPQTGLGPPAGL